ncbi:tetratricopeptide [Plectosphaerella plurivora]|uniref:protein O-GlcNAc transferase n=1 Tax=Plectosphaerella plurivora TaxID=936078 RepID=A0A9P8V3T8_9PEZI|nr:tetratricopeptide [Plectosphaerella plurivora]
MLPLVQMHHVVHPQNLNAVPSHLPYHVPHAQQAFPGPSPQRPLPIRTSLPNRAENCHSTATGVPSHLLSAGEHYLRRKTPSGTIDAGYDGTPAQLVPGPPALKHMVLSTSPGSVGYSGQPPRTSAPEGLKNVESSATREGASVPGCHYRPALDGPPCWFPPTDLYSPCFPLQAIQPRNNTSDFQRGLHAHRQKTQPNGHSVPRVSTTSSLPGFVQADNLPRYPLIKEPQSHLVPGPPYFVSPSLPPPSPLRTTHNWWSFDSGPSPVPNGPRNVGATHQAGLPMPAGKLHDFDTITSPQETAGPASALCEPLDFREKILVSAHQSYVELLAHHHHTRRPQQPGTLGFSGVSAKLQVFPKPPRHHTSHLRSQPAPPSSRLIAGTQLENGHAWHASFSYDPALPRPVMGRGGHSCPVSGARASMQILAQLCEQGGWQWAEGLVLGGCLHFGLDQFESALEWFTRASALNGRDVDSLSNVAATLYCLGRHEEAEQTWLSAIHTCPSALEAVEHLVGLLYKKKSTEAVQVIGFVQDALRLPDHHSQYSAPTSVRGGDNIYQPGFGSSGYAVPGSENGRVLALIHAKGTMQYTLKDIEQASKSFEEAVLVSTGRCIGSVQELVSRVQQIWSRAGTRKLDAGGTSRPLLLPPDRARLTAKLVFPDDGELDGLRHVPAGGAKRAAIQTTSNSLLSLAKILQDAVSSGTSSVALLRRPSGVADILSLYYLSLSLQESPSTANNVGILLASVPQEATSTEPSLPDQTRQPPVPGVIPGSGLALALSYYNYGLTLDPKHVHLHTNLGSLLKDIGQLDLAIQMYEKAVACDGNFDIALTNLANAVKDRGRVSDAITYYKRAVGSNPNFAEAICGLSTALNSVCDWRGRGGVVLNRGQHDRWHVDAQGMLFDAHIRGAASGLTSRVVEIVQKQLEEAASWGRGTLRQDVIASLVGPVQHSHHAGLSSSSPDWEDRLRSWSYGRWEGSRVLRLVERSARVTMHQWYCDKYMSGLDTSASSYARVPLPQSLSMPTAPTVLPFHTFTCPLTARDIRMISQRNASRISYSALRAPWLPGTVYPPPAPPSPQLKIGYVSSDFNNHPLAHLMQSVFGLHNGAEFLAVCYATTPSDKSVHRLQIEREAPLFRDASSWSSQQLVHQIVQDGIHVLVNLNGYTRGARNDVFAARPAPIQMSFMGFAGTLGAEWCDYILADATAIPPDTLRPWRGNTQVDDLFQDDMDDADGDWMYSENVIFCRDTFFCCDHAQSSDPGESDISWEEEQQRRWKMRKELFPTLADDVIILGNFNQLYKIEPSTFRMWLRILSHVPQAILWLLRFPEAGEANLRRTAKAWAGAEVASRIVFTDVAPKNQHIARARVCDLFLDTPECNAHTTAADVLWSSTPLLTCPRYTYKMCSRMAASILKGALPKNASGEMAAEDLVASSDEEYEELAVRLASSLTYHSRKDYSEGRGRLADLRKLLWESKWTCALFDTRRWVSDLEHAYQEAWRRWVAGENGDIYL